MTKAKLLALAAVMAMLLALPAMVLAQQQPPRPSVFGGTASVDGLPAANGTAVTAIIDGKVVATATVSAGIYAFSIAQPPGEAFAGKTVTFKVGAATASQTGIWQDSGGAELNLTASTAPPPTVAPPPGPVVGIKGDKGDKGDTGLAGTAGLPGPPGAKGDTGSTGPKGDKGNPGLAGSDGKAGGAGPKGATGTAGADATGAPGSKGDTGDVGLTGESGGSLLAIIALIFAIIAVIGAGGEIVMSRQG